MCRCPQLFFVLETYVVKKAGHLFCRILHMLDSAQSPWCGLTWSSVSSISFKIFEALIKFMVKFLAWLIHRQWHIPPICTSYLHIWLSFLVILRLIRNFQYCHPNSSNSYRLSPYLVNLTVERYWQNPHASWIGRWWT